MIHSSPRSASCLLGLLMRNMCSRSKQPIKSQRLAAAIQQSPHCSKEAACNAGTSFTQSWPQNCVSLIQDMSGGFFSQRLTWSQLSWANSWAANPANVTRSRSMCPLRLEMRTYLSIQNDFSGELAAGLGWLDKGYFSLVEAAFSPAVAPPPLPPPLLLASFSSPGTAQPCLHW